MSIVLSMILIFIGIVFTWFSRNINRYEKKDCRGLPIAIATVNDNHSMSDDSGQRASHTVQLFRLPSGEEAAAYDHMDNAVGFYRWPKRFKNPYKGEHEIYYWKFDFPDPDKILGIPNPWKGEPPEIYNGISILYESRFVDESIYDAFRYKGRRWRIIYYVLAIFFYLVAIIPYFI